MISAGTGADTFGMTTGTTAGAGAFLVRAAAVLRKFLFMTVDSRSGFLWGEDFYSLPRTLNLPDES